MPFDPTLALLALLLPLPVACSEAVAVSPEAEHRTDDEGWTRAELESSTAEIQEELAELRGVEFERPVAVRVTDGEGFLEHAAARVESLVPEGALAAEEEIAKLLGLVPPAMDLWATTLEMLEGQVGGFYDPGTDTFYLMESFTGGVARVIMAHELTHALDDQLYDIDGTLEPLVRERDASAAYMAVVEGSGSAMMTKWMLAYGGDISQQELLEAASMSSEGLEDMPAYLWKPLLASYTAGSTFLDRGYRLRKKEGKSFSDVIDEAFREPPRSTEQILHPKKYWSAEERDEPVTLRIGGELPEGWERVEATTLGELHLALVAAPGETLDLSNAMAIAFLEYTNDAAAGWGGDRVVLIAREDARLLHGVTQWDTPEDAREFRAALEERLPEWRAGLAEFDRGGVSLAPEDPVHPQRVGYTAWRGLSAEEAETLVQSFEVR